MKKGKEQINKRKRREEKERREAFVARHLLDASFTVFVAAVAKDLGQTHMCKHLRSFSVDTLKLTKMQPQKRLQPGGAMS